MLHVYSSALRVGAVISFLLTIRRIEPSARTCRLKLLYFLLNLICWSASLRAEVVQFCQVNQMSLFPMGTVREPSLHVPFPAKHTKVKNMETNKVFFFYLEPKGDFSPTFVRTIRRYLTKNFYIYYFQPPPESSLCFRPISFTTGATIKQGRQFCLSLATIADKKHF